VKNGIQGKNILVTSANGGIGRCLVQKLLDLGATVIALDKCTQQLSADFPEVLHSQLFPFELDITCSDSLAATYGEIVATIGSIDHLVNNAGIVTRARIADFPDVDWQNVVDINLTAVYRLTKLVLQHRAGNEKSSIVNIASMSYKGMTQQIAYSASKGGVVSLTKSCAMELARHNIRCNAVAPGMIETNMTSTEQGEPDRLREKMVSQIPLRRYGEPSEIANAITFLLSENSSYITGEVLHVSGGARL
jgi:3-oxoacyl-[acyl-carrier protein] reductase